LNFRKWTTDAIYFYNVVLPKCVHAINVFINVQ